MLLLTVTEFRNNISKYIKLAGTERVSIKSKDGIFDLVPNKEIRVNPSPSSDPYYDNPKNIEAIKRAVAEVKDADLSTLKKWDDLKLELGL